MGDEPMDFAPGWFHTPEFARDGLVVDESAEESGGSPDPASDADEAMFGPHTRVWDDPATPEDVERTPDSQDEPEHEAEPGHPRAETGTGTDEGSGDSAASLAGEEIAALLRAAQEAAHHILERAKATAEGQLADVARRREELHEEADRMSSIRRDVSAVVRSMASDIEQFRAEVEGIPRVLSEAFAPLVERIPAMQRDLNALAGALGAPLEPAGEAVNDSEEPEQIAG